MTTDFVAKLCQDAVSVVLLVAAPMLAAGLVLGLIIGVLQAITSVQEQTLSFIPKVIGVMVVFLLTMPWMLRVLMTYTANLFADLARFAGT